MIASHLTSKTTRWRSTASKLDNGKKPIDSALVPGLRRGARPGRLQDLEGLRQVPGADMGPGLQCVDTRTLREEDVAVTLVHAHYVFDDGQVSVVVIVEPTLDDVLAHMAAGFHGLICHLRVAGPDGAPFAAGDVPGFSSSPTDLWQEADLG